MALSYIFANLSCPARKRQVGWLLHYSKCVRAGQTQNARQGGLHNRFICQSSEGCKPQIRGLVGLVLPRRLLLVCDSHLRAGRRAYGLLLCTDLRFMCPNGLSLKGCRPGRSGHPAASGPGTTCLCEAFSPTVTCEAEGAGLPHATSRGHGPAHDKSQLNRSGW